MSADVLLKKEVIFRRAGRALETIFTINKINIKEIILELVFDESFLSTSRYFIF